MRTEIISSEAGHLGTCGEFRILSELMKIGLEVLKPASPFLPYDLAIVINNKLYKVQIKTSSAPDKSGSYKFTLGRTDKEISVLKESCDFVILWAVKSDKFYLIPVSDIKITRRLSISDSGSKHDRYLGLNGLLMLQFSKN